MSAAAKIAVGVASGYLLGRTKKLKLAITVGGMLAGKKIATDPRGLMQQALQLINSNPELSKLSDQVKGELFESVRAAAVAGAGQRMNHFSDSLRERSDRWGLPAGEDEGEEVEDEDDDSAEDAEEPEESAPDEEEPEESAPDEEEPEESAPDEEEPRKRSASKKAPAKKSAAKKASSGTKSAAKKAPAKKSTSAKKTSSGSSSASSRRGSTRKA